MAYRSSCLSVWQIQANPVQVLGSPYSCSLLLFFTFLVFNIFRSSFKFPDLRIWPGSAFWCWIWFWGPTMAKIGSRGENKERLKCLKFKLFWTLIFFVTKSPRPTNQFCFWVYCWVAWACSFYIVGYLTKNPGLPRKPLTYGILKGQVPGKPKNNTKEKLRTSMKIREIRALLS